ncbi:nuclear pore complex protein Nup153-like isoform 3-T4 [Hipposideros larvatus]
MPCASWAASFFLLSRSKQQPIVTWGILNRITESVKIVPQWLQSYFSRNEDVCSCSTDRREAAQQLENREDEHVINADEERANIHDGRITPEPTVSNTEVSVISAPVYPESLRFLRGGLDVWSACPTHPPQIYFAQGLRILP